MKPGTLDYYMTLDYPVEIRAIPDELGGGYSASIPYLGRWAFFAEGDTAQEALEALQELKVTLFEDMISRGKTIPLPPPIPEQELEEYSGRILLRIRKELHKDVARMAEKDGCSVNHYISDILTQHVGGAQVAELFANRIASTFAASSLEQERLKGSYELDTQAKPSLQLLSRQYDMRTFDAAS